MDVTISSVNDENVTAPFKSTTSGAFRWVFSILFKRNLIYYFMLRSGYVVLDLEDIPAGVLHITPSTFLPNQEGPFLLHVKATAPVRITRER